jgi:hypothetical protein
MVLAPDLQNPLMGEQEYNTNHGLEWRWWHPTRSNVTRSTRPRDRETPTT